MIALAFDPGVDGAAAVVYTDFSPWVLDLPAAPRPGGGMIRRGLAGGRLVELLYAQLGDVLGEVLAVVEDVHTFPGDRNAPQIGGSLMHSVGVIECALDVLRIRRATVAVHAWKKFYGIGPDKSRARLKAAQLMPDAADWLQRVKDHNRAEALLMAHYLQRTHDA